MRQIEIKYTGNCKRFAGDAEQRRQKAREANDILIKQGSEIIDFCFGRGVVIRANKKTYTIKFASVGLIQETKAISLFRGIIHEKIND